MVGITKMLCTGKDCPFAPYCERATKIPKRFEPLVRAPYDGYTCNLFIANKTFADETDLT